MEDNNNQKDSLKSYNSKPFNTLSSLDNDDDYNERKLNDVIDSILSMYPDGIHSLIDEYEKDTDNIALILILHGTKAFIKKYIAKAQRKISIERDRDSSSSNSRSKRKDEGIVLDKYAEATFQIANQSRQQIVNDIIHKVAETNEMSSILLQAFHDINDSNDKLLERIIAKYSELKAQQLKLKYKSEYISLSKEIMKRYFNEADSPLFNNQYYEITFEDFVILFCSIVRYYTGIRIQLELRNEMSLKVMLKCFCDEETYNSLANLFGYELQLKPYAYKYNEYKNKLKTAMAYKSDDSFNKSIASLSHLKTTALSNALAANAAINKLKFEALNHSNCLMFPPYMTFDPSKEIKFRRYAPNDDYHECRIDPEFYPEAKEICKKCSIYRGIDKLRLLYKALTHIMPLSVLYKHQMISMIIYQKNYRAYDKKLKTWTIFADTFRICCSQSYMKTLNTIRNYFGENISFYFLWVSFFFTWMLFPAFLGLIGSIIMVDPQLFINQGKIDTFKNFSLDYYDISIIAFGLIITIWATLFLKAWLKYESLFRYLWGMEHYDKKEPQSEYFVPDKTIPFIIGESLKTVTTLKTQFRHLVSFLVLLFLILFRCLIVFGLFYCVSIEETTTSNEILLIAGLSSFIIKVMSFTYEFIVYKITIWENYEKKSQLYNSQAFKLIFFEFFNQYSGMFYIAFYKPYHSIKCYTNNCLKELEYHLYALVFLNFFVNSIFEFSWYGLKKYFRMKKYHFESNMSSQSLTHQMSCDKKNNLIKEYNQKLIDFGYVCLFSVSAPLAPLLILIQTYFQNLFDIYKIFNLYRIEMIDGSSGIEIYYSKFKMLNYLGMITNTCLVLFTSPKLVHLDEYLANKITNNEDFIIKIIIFTIIENVMLLFMKVIKYKSNMIWFQHLEELKSLYEKKYFSRELNALPHISLEENRYIKED